MTDETPLMIFKDTAPALWELGLPVIPLRINDKKPFFDGWSRYCLEMPSQSEKQDWLARHAPNNIGLPLGPQSKIVCIDYDYRDPKVEAAILAVLPNAPWVRIGQKGWVRAFRFNGEDPKKIFDEEGVTVVEILSTGNQVVLPPSIHPKTMKPYTSNCNLADVYHLLPTLPDDIEGVLRLAIGQIITLKSKASQGGAKFNVGDLVPSGARDTQMIRHAGHLSRRILKGEVTVLQALDDMRDWFDNKVEKVIGDDIDVTKGFEKILSYLRTDVGVKNKILPPGWDDGLTNEQKNDYGLNFDSAQEDWTYQRLFDHVAEANKTSPNSTERMKMIDFALRKLAQTKAIDNIGRAKILQELQSDTKIPISDFKRRIKELQAGAIEGISHTEIAEETMREMQAKTGQLACWNDVIWCWEGTHWEKFSESTIRSVIQREFGHLPMARKYSDHKQIVQVMRDQLPQKLKADGAVDGVNFANGFLNKDMKLMAHSPEYGMTYTLPFQYRPELMGKSPKFFNFLQKTWGNDPDYEEKKLCLAEMIAATMFGKATSLQKAFLLYGIANTGKSVVLNIVSALIPDETRTALSPDKWDAEYIAAQFSGKLLNVCGEIDEKKKINGKLFKEIIAGDEITSRNIYGSPFKFHPNCAHMFGSNYLPKTNDSTNGFNRRWQILTFNRVVPAEEVVRDLDKVIIFEEVEAIVAWAIQAYGPLIERNDYTMPSSHYDALESMSMQNSVVRQWMSDRLIEKEGAVSKEGDFYLDYFTYCIGTAGVKHLPPKAFALELNTFLAEKRKPKGTPHEGDFLHKNLELKKGKHHA